MPRYYFDIHDGNEPHTDMEGAELADDKAAREEATRTIADLAKEYLPHDGSHRRITVAVRRTDGSTLLDEALAFDVNERSEDRSSYR
jgi:hypothetical protein